MSYPPENDDPHDLLKALGFAAAILLGLAGLVGVGAAVGFEATRGVIARVGGEA